MVRLLAGAEVRTTQRRVCQLSSVTRLTFSYYATFDELSPLLTGHTASLSDNVGDGRLKKLSEAH